MQSNMSTPRAMASSTMTQSHCNGFVFRQNLINSTISYIFSVGSPTARPPMALPSAPEATFSPHDVQIGVDIPVMGRVPGCDRRDRLFHQMFNAAIEPSFGKIKRLLSIRIVCITGYIHQKP